MSALNDWLRIWRYGKCFVILQHQVTEEAASFLRFIWYRTRYAFYLMLNEFVETFLQRNKKPLVELKVSR